MNKRKTKPPIPEPTSEEISNSKFCVQAIESFITFKQSNNSNNQYVIYETFVKDLNIFVFNESNVNLIKYYSATMIQEAIKFCSRSAFNKGNVILLFDTLDKIVSYTTDINTSDFSNFIFSLMSDINSYEIFKKHIKMLETLFSDDNFFLEFVEQQRVEEFFDISFINFKSVDFCYLFRHLVCEVAPKSLLQNVNLTKILSFLLSSIEKDCQIEYSIVLTKLIVNSPRNRLFLNNTQSFILFSNNIQSASSDVVIDCFNDLLFTSHVNIQILTNFILFYQKYPQHQTPLFKWIFENVIQNHTDLLYEINYIIPYSNWITLSTAVSDVIKAILILTKYDINLTSPFISPLLSLLNKGDSTFEDYRSTIQIIENHLLLRLISLNSLADSIFLRTFVINIQIDLLGQLFEKIYTFAQLIYDIYTLPQSAEIRGLIINKLIQMAGKFPQNGHFISIFLVVSNSKKNISDLMKTIIDNKNGDLCVALGDSFIKSETVVKYFINGNGIEWLDKIYKMKILNLQQFVFLINSLTRNYFIKEVDNYINSLPKNHPIFSLGQEDLVTLCYGYEGAQNCYPLKILSLFPLLKSFEKVDPYNAYMIGKYAFDKLENISELPLFSDVVNRYITDDTFHRIIKMDPSKFELFCDQYYDHFPLFQVCEFLDENSFDVKFKAISFWFKFDSTVRKELKIPFFHADKLQLFLKDSKLIANYEGVEYDAEVNPLKWNNVIVVVSGQKVSHYVDVYVNLNKAVFISSRILDEMPNFEFSSYSAFLFIGPAIRIYQKEKVVENDIENIYKNGPSFLGHLNESIIITPSSKGFLKLGKNVCAVKYRGFPIHFLSKRKLNFLFERLTNSECKENEFHSLVVICFKIYSLLRNSIRDFFHSIFSIYSKMPNYVTPKLLLETINFMTKYKNKKEIIDEIIGHKNLWSSISNDLLINSLLMKFKNFDFYPEKEKLELFLSIKSFSSKNTQIFENLFLSSKYCQEIIHEFFTGSHFISNKQDKFTQCFLGTNLNDSVDNSIETEDQNNVSIQCNLFEKSSFLRTFPSNFDLITVFQTINPVPFQIEFAKILDKMITTTKKLHFVPFDGVYSLFLTSDTELKRHLFSVLLKCEKISPNSVQFDSAFLSNIPQLFNKSEIWKETFNLMTEGSRENITKPSLLPVLFALLWGATVASVHSIASTGKAILNDNKNETSKEISKILKFLMIESNLKMISNDKSVRNFINSWFPFILGDSIQTTINKNNRFIDEGYETQTFKLNGVEITSPSPFCFISMIWRKVIKESGLPIETKKENYKLIQSFIVCSHLFNFYFNFLFSLSDSHFTETLSSFLAVPFVSSNKELADCYACDLIHSLLNIVAESYSLTMNIHLIFPFIHYLCFNNVLSNNYITTIISDLFLISSVIFIAYQSSFKKLAHLISRLLLHLFCYSLKEYKDEPSSLFDVLYQVLLQQFQFLIKIASESQNEIDLYLLFFKQSHRFCPKKETFEKVVTQFCKELNLTDFVVNDEIDLSKWNEFEKTNIIPFINQNETNHLSINSIRDCSKSFTYSFLNAIEKQILVSENLNDLFNQSEIFSNSKVDWNRQLRKIWRKLNNSFYTDSNKVISIKTFESNKIESTKFEESKILTQFMLPLRIPRLFVFLPSMMIDANKFINDLGLYKIPLQNLDGLIQQAKSSSIEFDEKDDIVECQLKRLTESIDSIMLILNRELLIFPFHKLSDLNKFMNSSEVIQFVKEVFDGLWGYSILFAKRIIIRIPFESILLIEQIDKHSIAIWSTSSGSFIINNFSGDLERFISRFKDRRNFPFYSSLRIPTLERLIIEWKNSRVSNSQLLLGVNLFNHRMISDLENFPIFPQGSTVFGVNKPINDSLKLNLIQPSKTVNGELTFSNNIEESQSDTTKFISDKFMLSIFVHERLKPSPLFDGSSEFLSQKLNTEKLKDEKVFDFDYNNDNSNKMIFDLPKLSSRISDENELIYLIVDKGKLSINLYDYKNDKIIYEERSSLLANAKNLYVSENRFFFSIDLSTDITCIYQIVYSNWTPKSFKFIRDISFEWKQFTCISGVDWIAASKVNNHDIVLWHFFPNTIHRIIKFDSFIDFVKLDENSGTVWVVSRKVANETEADKFNCDVIFTLLSLNGDIFANTSLHLESNRKIKITCFNVVPQPISINVREAICGFNDGSIYFLSIASSDSNSDGLNDIRITKLNSSHELPIKRIICHPCTHFFVSADSGNMAFFWSQRNNKNDSKFLDLSSFECCASCGNEEVVKHCISCGRAFCQSCIESEKKCKKCLEK